MPPRFDAENLKIELSVGDLIDATLTRHLGFANRGGYERRWLGQAIHSRYQEQALAQDPTYRKEVAIAATFEHRGWQITVHGRIDGLYRTADGVILEEIKSIRRGAPVAGPLKEIYTRQALLYAWMLHQQEEMAIGVELVWIEIGSEEIERERLEFRYTAVDGAVRRRLSSLLRDFEKDEQQRGARHSAAARLEFPHAQLRPGQETILEAVERSLNQEDHLLVQATTGIGKTVAALVPALRYALEHDKRVFILTAKTLQQEMAVQVLKLLNSEETFHSVQLRAKAKMCANDQLICHEDYCVFARDFYSKLHGSAVLSKLWDSWSTLLPDSIFGAARDCEVCPFEISLELSRKGQVVVCDYNYAFDPYVALSDFHQDNDLRDVVLVIDEIHNLVGRGRGYYSPILQSRQALDAAEFMAQGREAVHAAARDLCRKLAQIIEHTVEEALLDSPAETRAIESPLPEDSLWAFRPAFDEVFVDYLEYRRETSTLSADDPFVDLYFKLLRFLDCLQLSGTNGEAFSHCIEQGDEGPRLRILCKDPSRFLGSVLNRVHSAVGLSATLSPSDFYRDLLGFDPERLDVLTVPSPFPSENRSVVIDASVSTLYRLRPQNYPKIADRLAAFADRVPGNLLALFPSYRFLDEVASRLEVRHKRVLIQSPSGSDREREEILEILRSAVAGNVLLMAVAGGVFAEGVDYPGDMLKAVAVVGPCLPAVSLEQDLLRRYYDERFERGFEYAYAVPGMTRVVQAAGRLIRSADDTGVIALLDKRFLTAPYRLHLPADWLLGEPAESLVGDPETTAGEFFSRRKP
jgi:DNA excision repair protein ERCC-2